VSPILLARDGILVALSGLPPESLVEICMAGNGWCAIAFALVQLQAPGLYYRTLVDLATDVVRFYCTTYLDTADPSGSITAQERQAFEAMARSFLHNKDRQSEFGDVIPTVSDMHFFRVRFFSYISLLTFMQGWHCSRLFMNSTAAFRGHF
jgi:hypothetical protein